MHTISFDYLFEMLRYSHFLIAKIENLIIMYSRRGNQFRKDAFGDAHLDIGILTLV